LPAEMMVVMRAALTMSDRMGILRHCMEMMLNFVSW
jgi:hypothetical protein